MHQTTLEILNDRTNLHWITGDLLDALDRHLKYPTDLAAAEGWRPPTQEDEEDDRNTWDGWAHLLHRPTTIPPWFPSGLLQEVQRVLAYWNVPHQVIDRREKPADEIPEFPAVPLRDYQEAAVSAAVREGRGVFDMVPRSGKTRCGVETQRRINQPCLWLAPTDRIVSQTLDVYNALLGANYAVHVIGSKGAKGLENSKVMLCTAATANVLPLEIYATRRCIIVDEFHHSASSMYQRIFKKCDHIFYRFGLTGTFFRSGGDSMAMHGLLGNTLYRVTAEDMLRMGYLVPTRVCFMPVDTAKLPSNMGAYNVGHGKLGIHENVERNWLAAWSALNLHAAGRRVLILVGTKAQGRMILDYLRKFLPPSPAGALDLAEFVSTDTPRPRIKLALEGFLAGAVGILIGTSLLGEGVDLPVADALVYARGEKAEVSLVQNMYRVGTACPGKTEAIMVDFADRHQKKLLEHVQERARVYYEAPTFTPQVLERPDDFFSWAGIGRAELVRYRV